MPSVLSDPVGCPPPSPQHPCHLRGPMGCPPLSPQGPHHLRGPVGCPLPITSGTLSPQKRCWGGPPITSGSPHHLRGPVGYLPPQTATSGAQRELATSRAAPLRVSLSPKHPYLPSCDSTELQPGIHKARYVTVRGRARGVPAPRRCTPTTRP